MNIFIKIALSLFLALVLFSPASSFAAEVFFDSKEDVFTDGEDLLIEVLLNTEEESLNAIEGKIMFPGDILEVREILEGNSAINFWVDKPSFNNSGEIYFSGITPGGFSGSRGLMLSVIFKAKKSGEGMISAGEFKILKNDGIGTSASIKISTLGFMVLKSNGQIFESNLNIPKDADLPEAFKPDIARNPEMFDGKYFLIFSTQDKGSGVDHYEVREGRFGGFSEVSSPYILKYQSLDKKIFVKAVDKAGNERIATFQAKKLSMLYQGFVIFGIILVIVFAGFLLKILWPRFIKRF